MRRRSKRILAGIGIIIIGLGTWYAVALARSTAKLREARAALEKDGRPMNAADVTPAKVPEEQNAAILYKSAAAMLKAQVTPEGNLLRRLSELAAAPFKKSDDPYKVEKYKQEVAELEQLMAQEVVAQAISVVEQGTQHPACLFYDGTNHGLSLEAPGIEDVRDLTRIVGTKAHFEANAGRPEKAWDVVLTLLRLADGPRNEPSVGSHFAHTGMISYSCWTIQKLCETAPPGDENYAKIDGLLTNMDDVGPMVHAVDAERLLLGEWLFNLPDDDLYEMLRKNPWGMKDTEPGPAYRLTFRLMTFRPRFIADHAAYLQIMGKSVRLLQNPYVPRDSPEYKEIEKLMGPHNFVSGKVTPMVWGIQWFHCRTTATLRMTLMGLALLRYRQAHGAWPQSLDALNLKNVADPFSQQPLHYRAEGEGFLVYSVGEDQKDDGGIAEPLERRGTHDMIWRFPEPKAK